MRDAPDENDEMIKRIVDELRTLPPVPADATARVLARVDAARRDGSTASAVQDDEDVIFFPTSTEEMRSTPTAPGRPVLVDAVRDRPSTTSRIGRRFVLSLPAAIGYALAATLVGFLIRGAVPHQPGQRGSIARGPAPAETLGQRTVVTSVAVSRRDMQEAPLKVQFVLDARHAKSVAVVGDFNDWDKTATPLQRDSTSGIWSTLASVRPGRHVYAFLVDGTVWTLDPNAPRAKDADYGTEQSVLIAGPR